MRTKKAIGFSAAFLLLASLALGNVLVYDVQVDTVSDPPLIKYKLLDNASSVKIEVFGPLPATTVLGQIDGTTVPGQNQVIWTGFVGGSSTVEGENYGFRVIAAGVPHADYTSINDLNNTFFHFEQPRGGVAVNKNMESDYFSWVYVGNSRTGTTVSGRACSDGYWAMHPDGTDVLSLGDTPLTGGIDWSASDFSSPYHAEVGPDDMLYIPDWSDGHSGLWRAPADLSGTWEKVFDDTSRDSTGLCGSLHGSIAGIFLVENGSNIDIYWPDEDLTVATGTDPGDGLRNIWKTTLTPSTTLPIPDSTAATLVVDENTFSSHTLFNLGGDNNFGLFVNDLGGAIGIDRFGRIFIGNYRAGADNWPNLLVASPDGQHLWWDSRINGTGDGTTPADDAFAISRNGLEIDNERDLVYQVGYVGTEYGLIVIPTNPLPTGDLATAMTFVPNPDIGGVTSGGIDLDAAGNVYYTSNISERLHIYSPPGANSFTFERSTLSLPGGALFLQTGGHWQLYN